MAFLDISNVSKSYGSVEVLQEINIHVEKGELLVLVGPSGCGKSTLLNMIAGLEDISSGEISIKGRIVNGVHPSKRNIAMVFQSYALYPNMTVAKNITFGLEMHGIPKNEREQALKEVAKLLQIEPLLERKPSQLSGGQRQRVAMGRALVRKPDVFLFDEPLSNLDAKLRVDMRTEIKKLHQTLGTTIIYVTHDQIEAMTLSTRIAVMYRGLLQQVGTPKQIYNDPKNLFVAGFMGSPSMNLISSKIEVSDTSSYVLFQNKNGDTQKLEISNASTTVKNYHDKNIIFGIRPEAISAVNEKPSKKDQGSTLSKTVDVVEPSGSDTFVTLDLGDTDCIARLDADSDVQQGDELKFKFNMEKVVLFDPYTGERIVNSPKSIPQ